MSDVLKILINGTDYGPAGANIVRALEADPGGPDAIGLGQIVLGANGGGGYSFLPRMEVQMYKWNGTYITAVYYGGFLGLDTTTRRTGSTDKEWTIGLQDYNLLRASLVSEAAWAPSIHIAAGHFDTQINSLVAALTSGASKGIDSVSQVANLTGATNLPAVDVVGLSLDHGLAKIFANAVAVNAALNPVALLAPDYTVGPTRTTFGVPLLYVYDSALLPAPTRALSDTPSGGDIGILQAGSYQRSLDPASQVTRRQSVWTRNGSVWTSSNASAIATYPNPYDPHGAWQDEPLQDSTSTSNAQAQATIDQDVAGTAFPRETVAVLADVDPPFRPGESVALTLSLDAISAIAYQVGGNGCQFLQTGVDTFLVRNTLALGLPRLELGQTARGSARAPVVLVPPGAPTITGHTSTFQPLLGNDLNTINWTAPSASGGVVGYAIYTTTGGLTYRHTVAGVGTLAYSEPANLSTSYSYVVHSIGDNGLESVDSNTEGPFTSPPAYAPDASTGLNVLSTGRGEGWAIIGFTPPGTTHGPHDFYDVWWRPTTTPAGPAIPIGHLTIAGTSTTALLTGLTLDLDYTVWMDTISSPLWVGPISSLLSGVIVRGYGFPPQAGVTKPDQPLWPFTQVAGTGVAVRDATTLIAGLASYKLPSTGGDTITVHSTAYDTAAAQAWTVKLAYLRGAVALVLTGAMEWDDGTGTWALTASTLTLPTPTTSLQTKEQQVIAPTGAVQGRLKITAAMALAATLWFVLTAPITPVTSAANYGAASITDPAIATGGITDPTKFALRLTSSNVIGLYDAGGTLRGQLYVDSNTPAGVWFANAGAAGSAFLGMTSTYGDLLQLGEFGGANAGVQLIAGSGGAALVQSAGGAATLNTQAHNNGYTANNAGDNTIAGALNLPLASVSADTTLGVGHHTVGVSATGGVRTITLPAATTAGRQYIVYKSDAGGNKVTVAAGAGDTIIGAATYTLLSQFSSVTLEADGVHTWIVTGSH